MMQCQTSGCHGLSGAICTGAGQWIQFCPICKTKQAIQPPRQPDEADGLAVRALVDLQRANYAAAEKGFLDAAAKTAQDAPRQAFYLWCSLIARYGVEYVQEVQFESIPARRSCLFVPTFGRFPLPDHRITETQACRQLDMLMLGMPGVDVGSHLRELDILIQEIEDCCRDRKNQYNVFIAWHDRADDGHGPCRTFADRLNSYLNAQRDCYSFVSFRSLHDVIVDHYEPHIYTALASARVMVIVVDDLDAMQRKFLRSEINRFLIRRAANHKLHIYLCCMQGATGTPPAMMAGWQRRNGCENTDVWYELVTKDVMERLRDDTPAPKPEPVPQPEPPKPEPVPQPVPKPEPEPAPEAEQKKQKKIDWKNVLSTAYKVLKPIISNFFIKKDDVTGATKVRKRGLLSSITAILLCISQVVSGVVMPDGAESGQGFSALIGWVKQGWVSVFGEKGETTTSTPFTTTPEAVSYRLTEENECIEITIPKTLDSSIDSYALYRKESTSSVQQKLASFQYSDLLVYADKQITAGKSYVYYYEIEYKNGTEYSQSPTVTVSVPAKPVASKPKQTEKPIPAPLVCSLAEDNQSVNISIPARSDSYINRYNLYRKQEGYSDSHIAMFYTNDLLNYTDTSIKPGKTYTYYYVIVCTDGSKYPESLGVTVSIPKTATANKLTAAATAKKVTNTPTPKVTPTPTPTERLTPPGITYSFVNNAKEIKITIPDLKDSTIHNYSLYRKKGSEPAQLITNFSYGKLTYVDRNVMPGSTYSYYYIITCKDGSYYPRSYTVMVTVPKENSNTPTSKTRPPKINYTFAANKKGIKITIPKTVDPSITAYSLYRKECSTGTVERLAIFNPSAVLTYTDKDITSGKSYFYYYIIDCSDGYNYPESISIMITAP